MNAQLVQPLDSIWTATACVSAPLPQLEGELQADVVVIGGGFSGLSLALALAERGANVALLEAEVVGFGASGRTNGQVIPTFKKEDPSKVIKRYGPLYGPRALDFIQNAASDLFDLISKHDIACEANNAGWVQPAHTLSHLDQVKKRAHAWLERGADVELLDRDGAAEQLGTDYYLGAWKAKSGGSVQPLSLARGLAAAAVKAGAKIFEHSKAQTIRRLNGRWRVETSGGAVTTDQVMLASAVYTKSLEKRMSQQAVSSAFFQLATSPLPSEQAAAILPGCAAMSDLQGDIYFFRKDAGNRLITGGTFIVDNGWRDRLPNMIRRRLKMIYPHVAGANVESLWAGHVAMTPDFFPRFTKLGPGYWGWIGCNGRGVALSTALGRVFADVLSGMPEKDLPFPFEKEQPVLARPLAPVAIGASIAGYRLRDSIDRQRRVQHAKNTSRT